MTIPLQLLGIEWVPILFTNDTFSAHGVSALDQTDLTGDLVFGSGSQVTYEANYTSLDIGIGGMLKLSQNISLTVSYKEVFGQSGSGRIENGSDISSLDPKSADLNVFSFICPIWQM